MRLTTIERDSVALARQQGGAALDSGDGEELLVRDLAWDGRREDLHLDLSLGDDEVERWQAGSERSTPIWTPPAAPGSAKGSPKPACSNPDRGDAASPNERRAP